MSDAVGGEAKVLLLCPYDIVIKRHVRPKAWL